MTREPDPTTTVIVEIDLPEPPEKVWKALTVPRLLAKWLMPNDIYPEVGSRFRLKPDSDSESKRSHESRASEQGGCGSIECQVLEAEPNHRLRLSWREVEESYRHTQENAVDSIVTFELSVTTTGGTHLRLVHEGFEAVETNAFSRNVIQLHRRQHCTPLRTRKPPVAMLNTATYLQRAA